jgi:hypothetical protein
VGYLVLREPPEKECVVLFLGAERVRFDLDGVVDRAYIVQLRAAGTLSVGDGVEVDLVGDHAKELLDVGIERPVQGVQHRGVGQSPETRRDGTGVIVDDVVALSFQERGHALYRHWMHRVVEVPAAEVHGLIEEGTQGAPCRGAAGGVEGDVVAHVDEPVGEQADDPLYPAVSFGWHLDPG